MAPADETLGEVIPPELAPAFYLPLLAVFFWTFLFQIIKKKWN